MAFIYETPNFILESHEKPEVDRLEGGHCKISPKVPLEDRTKLTQKLAIELMRFTIASGKAIKQAMEKIGVYIGRINYQENGNRNPTLHIQLYGRAIDAKMQKYGEPIVPGNKPEYMPLNEEDRKRIKEELDNILQEEYFNSSQRNLS